MTLPLFSLVGVFASLLMHMQIHSLLMPKESDTLLMRLSWTTPQLWNSHPDPLHS